MTVSELVERFAAICSEQDKAEFDDDIATYNRLYDQKVAVLDELKERPGESENSSLETLGAFKFAGQIAGSKGNARCST
jgi:hypothetical protein